MPLSIPLGGSGSVTPAGARKNFGLEIGVNIQAFNEALTDAEADDWTPTITEGVNVADSTASLCHYFRIGDQVWCRGGVSVTPTAATNTSTVLSFSLPIASDLAASTDLTGTGSTGVAQRSGIFTPDTTNNLAVFTFASETTSATTFCFEFSYIIL